MTEHKKIMINESFFNTTSNGGNKTKKNKGNGRSKKEKPKPVLKPNSLKKTLLEKIKKHQQNEKMSKQNVDHSGSSNNKQNGNNDKFTDDFMNSMEYLSKLGDKNKRLNRENKKRNKSQKIPQLGGAGHVIQPTMILSPDVKSSELVSIELPSEFDTPFPATTPQYGGHMPTNYQQNTNNIPINLGDMSQISHLSLDQPPQQVQQFIPPVVPPVVSPVVSPAVSTIPPLPQRMKLMGGNTDTPYGCLKGGQKPTYRQYHNKTLKNTHKPIIDTSVPNHVTNRQHKLAKLKKSSIKRWMPSFN